MFVAVAMGNLSYAFFTLLLFSVQEKTIEMLIVVAIEKLRLL